MLDVCQNREEGIGIWLVQVQKSRLAASSGRIASARHLAADRGSLSNVTFGFRSGQPLNLRSLGIHTKRRKRHAGQYGYPEPSLDLHKLPP